MSSAQELQEGGKKMMASGSGTGTETGTGTAGTFLFPRNTTTTAATTKPMMPFAAEKEAAGYHRFSTPPLMTNSRTLKNQRLESAWRLTSLSAALRDSPSPSCGGGGGGGFSPRSCAASFTDSESFYSQGTTEFSSPKFQSTRSIFNKPSMTSTEADGWVQCGKILRSNVSSKRCVKNKSSAAQSPTLASNEVAVEDTIDQRNCVYAECTHNGDSSDAESLNDGRHKLIARPKPYNEFLDEVKAQELQAQIDAWKRAKEKELMSKLKREEAVIRDWEFKQIEKATKEMRKIECKLEKKLVRAQERSQKRMKSIRNEADKKVEVARESAVKKMSSALKECGKMPPKTSKSTKLIILCHSG